VLAGLAAAACSTASRRPGRVTTTSAGEVAPGARTAGAHHGSPLTVRIALARSVSQARLGADGDWAFYSSDGSGLRDRPRGGESWTVEAEGGRVAIRRDDGTLLPER
jgi:hypothetical protein